MADTTAHRVVLLHIDAAALTEEQRLLLAQSAGTSRAIYNWGLAAINAWTGRRYAWLRERAHAVTRTDGEAHALLDDVDWRREALRQVPEDLRQRPNRSSLSRRFTELSRDPDSRFHWWHVENHGVSRFVVSTALGDLDTAIATTGTVPVRQSGHRGNHAKTTAPPDGHDSRRSTAHRTRSRSSTSASPATGTIRGR